jgi:hypothetical protein
MIMACEMDVAVDIPHPVLCILLLKRPSQPVYDLLLRNALHVALSLSITLRHMSTARFIAEILSSKQLCFRMHLGLCFWMHLRLCLGMHLRLCFGMHLSYDTLGCTIFG